MKKLKLLFTVLCVLCGTVVFAYDFGVNGICYNFLSKTDKTVEVTFKGTSYSEYSNEYIDTLQFSRKLYPELSHHRLTDMAQHLHLVRNTHRSLEDCRCTKQLYDCIKEKMVSNGIELSDIFAKEGNRKRKTHSSSIDIKSIVPTTDEIDEDNFFYNKHCVFTGTLEKMLRKDAMQLVVNVGGIIDNNVIKTTNYLILGNNDYCSQIKDGKSNKQKKAESLKLKGQDIEIIDEF